MRMATPPMSHEKIAAGPAAFRAVWAPNNHPEPMIEPTEAQTRPISPISLRSPGRRPPLIGGPSDMLPPSLCEKFGKPSVSSLDLRSIASGGTITRWEPGLSSALGHKKIDPLSHPHRTTPARAPTSVIRVLAADSSAPPSRPPRRSGTRPLEHVGEEGLGPLLLWIADDIARGS